MFFKELFDYCHYYNLKLIQTILQHQDRTSDRALQLINHVVNAQHVWNSRILNISPQLGVWDMNSLEELEKWDRENFDQSIQIIDQNDMDEIIAYTTTKGDHYRSSIRDILFHIINHATHHRAQIIIDLKIINVEPIPMDYIFYKR